MLLRRLIILLNSISIKIKLTFTFYLFKLANINLKLIRIKNFPLKNSKT